ncbi:hypothetical protein Anas_01502 [Armadillidium nasatum]|uniref:Uncharacterized protein n=1 Tax=Armadillidium nasatum TaxID=96803 RepID=A0A5N5TN87_9CRUS|nr:hypothetical protein Anas_01502 [Armadillidium nasatum]
MCFSFGKLVFEKGSLHLKPHTAIPYILTTKDKQGVIEDFESPLTSLKVMSFIAGCGALYFAYRLGIKLHQHWQDFQEKKIGVKCPRGD